MIRRFWRWLVSDPEYDLLQEAVAQLADVVNVMTPEQQAAAFRDHRDLWWHAVRVSALIDIQRGRR